MKKESIHFFGEKNLFLSVLSDPIKIGSYTVLCEYRKTSGGILVFITINDKCVGEIFVTKKNDLIEFRKSLTCLSHKTPHSSIVPTEDKNLWKTQLRYADTISFEEIEETVSMYTVITIIELYFPTNWLILLP